MPRETKKQREFREKLASIRFGGLSTRDQHGRPNQCWHKATASDAERAVDQALAEGCTQQQGEREINRVLCGPGTSQKTFAEGQQRARHRLYEGLKNRDLPHGSYFETRTAEKPKNAGEAK